MKSGNLKFLEFSGPLQACNGTALPFYVANIDETLVYTWRGMVMDRRHSLSGSIKDRHFERHVGRLVSQQAYHKINIQFGVRL